MVGLLLPALMSEAGAQSHADLEEIEREIEAAQAQIAELEAQAQVTVAELDAINATLGELNADLDALNAELGAAQAELDNRERILAATTAELEQTEERLADTRVQLDTTRDTWEGRIRDAYITASPSRSIPIFGVRDVSEFAQASRYMEAMVSSDRRGFEQIGVLETQIAADEQELDRLRQRQEDERAAAERERDRVADLVAAQEALVAQVAAQAAAKEQALATLEADRESAQQLVAQLEAESAEIERQLAEIARQEEERRQAEAAAAAAAAAQSGSSGSSGSAGSSGGGSVSPPPASSGRFQWPTAGSIGSGFGYRIHPISGVRKLHAGVDIGAPTGQAIHAAESGTVVSAGWRGGYGNCVVINHGGGIATLYAHQSSMAVSSGQSVSRGQVIGYVGSTGYSTGPHLHFEVRVNGTPVDPVPYL